MSDSFTYEDLPANQQVLLQKQNEYTGLSALKDASDQLVERIEKLAGMSNIMADGGETVGQVMRNWPHVFSVLSLLNQQPSATNGDAQEDGEEALPQLVRLQYTEEAAADDKAQT